MLRSHTCGELNLAHVGQEVTLCGWVNKTRDLGGMTFLDLRDRYGMTQVTVDPKKIAADQVAVVSTIGREYVLKITGTVVARPSNMVNAEMSTGTVELQPSSIQVLSESKELPFSIDHENEVGEETRLQYRYLDLRRQRMKNNVLKRHEVLVESMKFFDEKKFVYIETPTLVKNTPEGSREFVVPSRTQPGQFYVLPQAPQQLKQLSMVAGLDRYFQFARCYRDEDPRGDRQPEFTQVDVEMSFIEQEDALDIIEQYFKAITSAVSPKKMTYSPFLRLTRDEVMNTYGNDKPELRTQALGFVDVSDRGHKTGFGVFQQAAVIKALVAPKEYGRSEIDRTLVPMIQQAGGKGLAYLTLSEAEGIKGSIVKFFSEEELNNLISITGAQVGETIFFQADNWDSCVKYMGVLRNFLLQDLKLLQPLQDHLGYAFVLDFPMFEIGDDGSLGSVHHPFTKPKDRDIPFVKSLALKIKKGGTMTDEDKEGLLALRADCYDIIANGYELGGGSIRITDPELQEAIFLILGLSESQIKERFGHLINAFGYGVPPHGGFAVGFDRYVMLIQDEPNIREVIAYPKNQKYVDLMLGSPSTIDDALMDVLGLAYKTKK